MGSMGQPSLGQPELFEHGIQTENADIRCHVAPKTRLVFVFRTAPLLDLDLEQYAVGWAGQPGVTYKTGKGYLVPFKDIPDLRILRWHSAPWWDAFSPDQLPQEKGRLAVDVASELLRDGRFPLWHGYAKDSDRLEVQHGGTDILLWGRWKIQVKCDYFAGPKDAGGTGNLFLQTAERNPLRRW